MYKIIFLIVLFIQGIAFSNPAPQQQMISADPATEKSTSYSYSTEEKKAWMENCVKSADKQAEKEKFCQCGIEQISAKIPPIWFLSNDRTTADNRQKALHAIFQYCAVKVMEFRVEKDKAKVKN